ncbi:hypothetical protein GCM10023191_087740 [Actinoallomurus oryzae]|uniref:Uncharacterized protein n=1 Tax=Actinoallomurus oryzae TaxID=502180 RepID=A0ABP8R2I5_9ACTN
MASWNGSALPFPERFIEDSSGGLKTLQAYAWPMERWIDNAAGGISQRLHEGGATVRDRSKKPSRVLTLGYLQVLLPESGIRYTKMAEL